jgi:hypothetical protein
LKKIFYPLQIRSVKIEKIEPAKVNIPGFKTYKVSLIDEFRHQRINKYVFISKEGNYITFDLYRYKSIGNGVALSPVIPSNLVKNIKTDISFIKKADKLLTEANIPHVIGKGNKKVYIVWDVFCPFCSTPFNKIEEIAKKNHIELHLIPLPVHGENYIKGLIYYTQLARKKGVSNAFKELYSLGNGDFKKYSQNLEKILNNGGVRLSKQEQEKITKTLKEVENLLIKNRVMATSTIIYAPEGKNKGYIHVDFEPIGKLLKEK